MKRKIIAFTILIGLVGLVTFQSCTKEPVAAKDFVAAMPTAPVPSNSAVVAFTGSGQSIDLTWAEGDPTSTPSWDVYFGTSSNPPKVATGVTGTSYTATVTTGGTYYWYVETTNNTTTPHPITVTSQVWEFQLNSSPNAPTDPDPAMNATGVSCHPTLGWTGTDPQDDELTYDLILDKSATPSTVVATGLSDASYTFTKNLTAFTDYYWKVIAHDPYGGVTEGPVWKFTTGAAPLPIELYTGSYTVDEPAEGWTYDVTFTMASPTTIDIDAYWASWPSTFTLDLANLTYSMPLVSFDAHWSAEEAGVLDPTSGKMVGSYTIYYDGEAVEQGMHTYTKN